MPDKKRTLDRETVSRLAARIIINPLVEKIGPLVDRAVFLETMARSGHTRHPELRREAALLANEARDDLKHLDHQLADIPTPVAEHPSVADTRNALVAVAERFERASSSL